MGDRDLLLAARELVYAVIARAYAEEPDAAFVQALEGDELSLAVRLLDDGHEARLEDGLERMRACCRREDGEALSRRLSDYGAEYVRIFIGPGTLSAAPWESAHVAGGRPSAQPTALDVREAYRRAGLLPVRKGRVADDFVGLEFDFMANLAMCASMDCRRGRLAACCERLSQSQAFLQAHLQAWVASLARAVRVHYGDCLYASVTEFAALWVSRDADIMRGMLEDCDSPCLDATEEGRAWRESCWSGPA